MQNEWYYKSELSIVIQDWLDKETLEENEFGFISSDLANHMTEAAFSVLKYGSSLSVAIVEQDLLK